MCAAGEVIEGHLHRLVLERARVVHALDANAAGRSRQRIRLDRVPAAHGLAEPCLVDTVRDDGQALGHRGAQAAGVVEVVVAQHQLRDRLARHQLLGLRQHRPQARLGAGLDNRHVVGELHHQVRNRAAGQKPDALGQRGHRDRLRRWPRRRGGLTDGVGCAQRAEVRVQRVLHHADVVFDPAVERGHEALGRRTPSRFS